MKDIIGIAWFKDELTYHRALEVFPDSRDMPASFKDWETLVKREREEVERAGNIALRVDIDPETFVDWCCLHGFQADSKGRTAFVNHAELEYQKTGKGTIIEQFKT
jgi:hypothetical protein